MTNQSKETLSVDPIDLIEEDEPTIKQVLHLYWFEPLSQFSVFTSKLTHCDSYIYAGPVEVDLPVPADFDPRAAKLASLREEEKRVRAEFQARITELQRQQSELLALEMAV